MVSSNATTVKDYLASLPEDRREAISAVRDVILENLPKGYGESMQYGMIGYGIPLARYPNTYNGQPLGIVALASQKQYMSVYLMGVYGDQGTAKWFENEYAKTGKKLDMGKSCVRFKKLEDLPLELIGQAVARVTPEQYIEIYERARAGTASERKKAAPGKTAALKTPAASTRNVAAKKSATVPKKSSASVKEVAKKSATVPKKTSAPKRPAASTKNVAAKKSATAPKKK